MTTMNPNNRKSIGIDVSKHKLDVYCLDTQQHTTWSNDLAGLTALIKQLKHSGCTGLIVAEATGGYEKLCHERLVKAGFSVHIADPRRAHYFNKQKGYYAKTDAIDAKSLAEYGDQETLEPTRLKSKKEQERELLCARRSQLVEVLTVESNRLKEHFPSSLKRSIKRFKKWLEIEKVKIEDTLRKSIASEPELKEKAERLLTFKGVGEVTVNMLLSSLTELGQLSRQEIASLCGLAPKNRDSGRLKGKRMVMGGRAHVRKTLYMSALAAITHNPALKRFYQRLKAAGKPSKVCLTAVMRKIIITLNAMLRDGKDWQEEPHLSAHLVTSSEG